MKLLSLTLALASCGCVAPPKRVDPFANLSAGGGIYRALDLAMVLSDNTRTAVTYLDGVNAKMGMNPSARFDASGLMTGFTAALQQHFKSVSKLERLEDADPAKHDLVCVLDVYAKIGMISFAQTQVEGGCHFMRLDGSELAAVKGEGLARVPYPAFTLRVNEAAAAAHAKFLESLAAQPALKELAQAKPQAPRAQTAQAAARVYVSDVDRPSYKAAEKPDRFALVVGIEKYESLPSADFAERDARAVREHLLGLGYPERNVVFLTGSKAGKAGIQKYVESWLPRNVKAGSRVFVYFSGHGAPDPVSGEAFLVPWDGDPKFLEDTGYPIKRLYSKLGDLKAKEVLVALDACFSGAGGRSVLPKGTRPLVAKVDAGLGDMSRLVVFSASSSEEITGAEEVQGHGLFTYHFLKGLNETRGSTTVQGLYDYLRPKVQDAARRDNRDQSPQLMPASLGDRAQLGF
ncbi:MAG: caspase family protein [Elusimicrobia bacterium]|nr:caspase family protein [Elusimicrobiota bacterium]